jgi:hypothetical protein
MPFTKVEHNYCLRQYTYLLSGASKLFLFSLWKIFFHTLSDQTTFLLSRHNCDLISYLFQESNSLPSQLNTSVVNPILVPKVKLKCSNFYFYSSCFPLGSDISFSFLRLKGSRTFLHLRVNELYTPPLPRNENDFAILL